MTQPRVEIQLECCCCGRDICGHPALLTMQGPVCPRCVSEVAPDLIYCVICDRAVPSKVGELHTEVGMICKAHAGDYCLCGCERAHCRGRCAAVALAEADRRYHSQ